MKIVLASSNRNKYREMKEAFRPIGVELIYGGDSDAPIEVDETGESYEENALLKARAWSEALGMAALADDSGLEVFALVGVGLGQLDRSVAHCAGGTGVDQSLAP